MEELNKEQEKLERDVEELNKLNAELEERVATMLADCKQADREKQWVRTIHLLVPISSKLK